MYTSRHVPRVTKWEMSEKMKTTLEEVMLQDMSEACDEKSVLFFPVNKHVLTHANSMNQRLL